ncbi:uncharacterized protein EDB91DRAFT_1237941 [Suillus paluster]|uniref:uncharacterized protein n=1 Tax=Suillus paluster TaxID=48578 RepID=UPI001B873A1A|nr:uncharacterized protein EDB91DRAFT_1237941 [Suillus paluster]KAG1737099.1 hypothetical protein EDB91DRAFT_1237941 [Suillus paluster]
MGRRVSHLCPMRGIADWINALGITTGYLFHKIASGDWVVEANQPMHHWLLHQICEWGGWSAKFTNMTIVKYLISHNDDPTEPHEEFFNPDHHPTVKCPHCGRLCSCT